LTASRSPLLLTPSGLGDSDPACDPGWLMTFPGLLPFSGKSLPLRSPFSGLSVSGSSELRSTFALLLAKVFCISSIILAMPPPELLPTVPYPLDELPLELPEFSELAEPVLTPFVFFNFAAWRAAAKPDIGFS